ncbi:MAG: hypothetical protein DLM60_16465 [Pseudonocardiales bacterium]|nr:MAG: hypothetical protein DLM60_16465 [Pseudonocardiales bacterium]
MRSARLGETLLPTWLALPVFCSDPISSVAYATEQIFLVSWNWTQDLVAEWDRRDLPVRLKVLAAPYRDLARPLVEYVRNYAATSRARSSPSSSRST